MNEVLFTLDVTLLDFITSASIIIVWVVVMIIYAIQRHKERREDKKMYEEWLNMKS